MEKLRTSDVRNTTPSFPQSQLECADTSGDTRQNAKERGLILTTNLLQCNSLSFFSSKNVEEKRMSACSLERVAHPIKAFAFVLMSCAQGLRP